MNAQDHQMIDGAHNVVALIDDLMGFVYSAALGAAARLGVADRLADGPRTATELAEATATHAPSLHRVLRLLAARGVLNEDGEGRFELTPLGDPMRSAAPLSVRAAVDLFTGPMNWQATGQMVTSLREGTPAFDAIFGAPYFAVLERDPDAATTFHHAMAGITQVFEFLIAAELDLPASGTVVDVGGGFGGLLLAILRRHPGLHGILFDRPQALASHQLGALDADRWEVAEGDFFAEVPSGAEVYVLKGILHDWSDEQCVAILRNCRRAMKPGSRILLIEAVIQPGTAGTDVKALDVMMMGLLPGRERTAGEFATLLDAAGLQQVRMSASAPLSTIEAIAA